MAAHTGSMERRGRDHQGPPARAPEHPAVGPRSCHDGECPYLPEILDVHCPDCFHNFHAEDGNPACGDPPDRTFAREQAPARAAALQVRLATGQLPVDTG
ncbi:MAG: hypothetical protein ACNA8R_13065 [Nitriliruptoraceae bacterium]